MAEADTSWTRDGMVWVNVWEMVREEIVRMVSMEVEMLDVDVAVVAMVGAVSWDTVEAVSNDVLVSGKLLLDGS